MTQQKSERNSNKKTVVIVALLLALIALLCFGGYTFSKYVTSGSGAGEAQVAKWGYTVKVDGSKLFGKKYEFDGKNSVVNEDAAAVSVSASDTTTKNIVAPGTTGSMTFEVKGTAEVSAMLNIKIDVVSEVSLTATKGSDSEVYNPIKWTLKKNGTVMNGADGVTLAKIAEVLNNDAESKNKAIEANTDLGTDYVYELSWKWAFTDDTTTVAGFTVDELDTFLGQNATESGEYKFTNNLTTSFNLTIKIEQTQDNL